MRGHFPRQRSGGHLLDLRFLRRPRRRAARARGGVGSRRLWPSRPSANDGGARFETRLLDQLNDAIIALGADFRVTFWSGGAEQLYGVSAQRALGRDVRELYLWHWLSEADERRANTALATAGEWRGENVHTLPSGSVIYVESTVAALKDEHGRPQGFLAVIRDITERKLAERERLANEARWRVAAGNLEIAVFNQDRELRYTWVYAPLYAELEKIVGHTDDELRDSFELTGFDEAIAVKRRVLENGAGARATLPIGSPRGLRWFDLSVEPLRDETGAVTGLTAAALDISERVQSEHRLRALAQRLQSVREEEQARIARDLHDELGQQLTAMKLRVWSLERTLEKLDPQNDSRALDGAVATTELADRMISTVRRISAELRPATLDKLGLLPALREELRSFQGRTGISCTSELPESLPELDDPSATAMYRICQEALTNVARHARATNVTVALTCGDERVTLRIQDDGAGFDAASFDRPGAFGLIGMLERARALGGDVQLESRLGQGTVVVAWVPRAVPANRWRLS